jgi:hypothetical protein
MPLPAHRSPRALIGAALLAASGVAAAQWVFLARHAIGRVEQMSQAPATPGSGAGYDVATVIVEVAPDKVFDVVKRRLAQSTGVRLTKTDDSRRSVEFTDGSRIGGIQVNPLGDNLAQLLVSTAHPGTAASPTSTLVQRILDVCRDLGVSCQKSGS